MARLDFWNDPRRWDGVDPHKQCFWSVHRPDVIDVRRSKPVVTAAQNQQAQLMMQSQLQNSYGNQLSSLLGYGPAAHSLGGLLNVGLR